MKKYDKEPFEELTEEQLDALLKMTKVPMTESSTENIKKRVNQKMTETDKKILPMKKKRTWLKIIGVAAALSIMVGFTQRDAIKVAYQKAFGTESEKLLLNADKLNESTEDQGLKLTAKSSFKDGETTYVMMTLQDLTEDRLDEGTLIDRWDMLNGGNTRVIDYDKSTKTATLLTSAISWEEHQEQGFRLERFMSRQKEFEGTKTVDWEQLLQEKPNWVTFDDSEGFGGGYNPDKISSEEFDQLGKKYLETEVTSFPLNDEGTIVVENGGYREGWLHLLVKKPNDLTLEYAFVSLISKDGKETIDSLASYAAGNGTHSNETGQNEYEEFVFDIPKEELKNYDIALEGRINQTIVTGDWAIKLKEPKELEKRNLEDITLKEGIKLTQVELSGLSLRFNYQTAEEKEIQLKIDLHLKNGEVKSVTYGKEDSLATFYYNDNESMVFNYNYVELSDILGVEINGQMLTFK